MRNIDHLGGLCKTNIQNAFVIWAMALLLNVDSDSR